LSFEDALNSCAQETGVLLDRLLPLEATPARRLIEAMRYAALGPGKRLRPFLVVESAALFDVPRERALRVGAALECVHCYSLVHDDLPAMDDDDLRRGKPTTHRAFDVATAILAGDALLTYAFEILADPQAHPDANVRLALISGLAKASGMAGMVGGQMLDMAAEDLVHMQSLKTGALFRFACEAGAVLGSADAAPLRQYADNIGLAYQIADDILDVESTLSALGKATQKDKGKATFVVMLGLEGAKARAEALAVAAIDALEVYGPRVELLREAARFMVSRRK
jgi:farnesyl diphosphate synthase